MNLSQVRASRRASLTCPPRHRTSPDAHSGSHTGPELSLRVFLRPLPPQFRVFCTNCHVMLERKSLTLPKMLQADIDNIFVRSNREIDLDEIEAEEAAAADAGSRRKSAAPPSDRRKSVAPRRVSVMPDVNKASNDDNPDKALVQHEFVQAVIRLGRLRSKCSGRLGEAGPPPENVEARRRPLLAWWPRRLV